MRTTAIDDVIAITPARRLTLAIGLPLVLAMIIWGALDLVAWTSPVIAASIEATIASPGSSLSIGVDAGSLALGHSQDGRVHVRGTARSGLRPASLRWSRDGSRLVLSLTCPVAVVRRCSFDGTIAVPDRMALQASTRSGSIAASGLTGAASLHTDSGDIRLAGLAGDLEAASHSGAISGTGLRAAHAVADVDSGPISLRFTTAPRQVGATSRSGSIVVSVPRRTYRVSTHTLSGSSTVDVPTDTSSPDAITASTYSGDVRIVASPPSGPE